MMFSISTLSEKLFPKFLIKPDEDNVSIVNLDSFPFELLTHILSFVPPYDLVHNCRLVCRNWNQLITDNGSDVWKRQIHLSNSNSLSQLNDIQRIRLKLPWHVFYQIWVKDPFEKNLLRNNCGRWVPEYYPELHDSQYEHWEVLLSEPLSCLVIRYPFGYHPFPESEDVELNPIYRTSFLTTSELNMQQTIDLCEHGLSRFIMDEVQPKIIASEWFSGSESCDEDPPGNDPEFALKVSLLASDRQCVIQQKEVLSSAEDWEEFEWKKVSIEFENYGPGARYVVFYHHAKQNGSGLGTRMGGAVLKVVLPIPSDSSTVDASSDF